ncbi:hypothetical protein PMEGAS228_55980 [Priestia megaterium]
MSLKKKLHKSHSIKNEWFFICLAKITKKIVRCGPDPYVSYATYAMLKKRKKHAPGRTIFLHVISLIYRMQF